ncbi:MAG TPA: HD domain-containing protein [Thermoplasmatales archaeon]|nr:HD domain-containing protein [Thermoplasmatales archaeon]
MTELPGYEKRSGEQIMIKADTGKRRKENFISSLREGDIVNELFAVKRKDPLRGYRKGTMFSFIAADKTGEIEVKFWGGENRDRVKRLYESFKAGDVVQIRSGVVELYNEKLQISINETTGGMRRCSPEEYESRDFIAALTEEEIEGYYRQLLDYMKKVENPQLRRLLDSFFGDPEFVDKFKHIPSAITHHHNYIGGNLQHTLGVVRLCDNICDMYNGINRDLVITGAILHDIGKIREYKVGVTIDKTGMGNFIGHIVIGDRWIREKIEELREQGEEFDEELENYICHMILSHHGRYEYGSPRLPKIVEAQVLFQADLMDSQVKNYLQTIEENRQISDEEWVFVWDGDIGKKKAMYLVDITKIP